MILTDELLLKFADDLLDREARADVDRLLQSDLEAAERLRLIRVSGDALGGQASRPAKASAASEFGARVLAGEFDSGAWPVAGKGREKSELYHPAPSGLNWGYRQIAACFVFLMTGLAAGVFASAVFFPQGALELIRQPTWLVRVVDYHTLYARETVASSKASPEEVSGLEKTFSGALGQNIVIPDLKNAQLEFRRGQILKFDGQPIVQLAYLPFEAGHPVALCLKRTGKKDTEPVFSTLRGLGFVHWRRKGIEYVLVGDQSEARLRGGAEHAIQKIGNS